MMLKILFCVQNYDREVHCAILACCFFDAPEDDPSIILLSKPRFDIIWYESRYSINIVDGKYNFVFWHNCECFYKIL